VRVSYAPAYKQREQYEGDEDVGLIDLDFDAPDIPVANSTTHRERMRRATEQLRRARERTRATPPISTTDWAGLTAQATTAPHISTATGAMEEDYRQFVERMRTIRENDEESS